jgi:hypothetical protein
MHPMLHVDFYDDIYLHPVECSSSNAVNTWERIYLQCLLPAMSSSSQTCSGDDDDVLMIVIIGMMYLQIIKIKKADTRGREKKIIPLNGFLNNSWDNFRKN